MKYFSSYKACKLRYRRHYQSDETTFHNTSQLNEHNSRYRSVENPYWHRQVNHQHRWSLIVVTLQIDI